MDKYQALNEIIKTKEKVEDRFDATRISYTVFKNLVESTGVDGFVIYDVGGDMNDWIRGLTGSMYNSGVVKTDDPSEVWWGFYLMTCVPDRDDLVMIFNLGAPDIIDMQKFHNWRADKPKNCLVSQYLVQHAPQFYRDDE